MLPVWCMTTIQLGSIISLHHGDSPDGVGNTTAGVADYDWIFKIHQHIRFPGM